MPSNPPTKKSRKQLKFEIEDLFDYLTVNTCDSTGVRSEELAEAIRQFGQLRYAEGVADAVALAKTQKAGQDRTFGDELNGGQKL